MMSNNQPDSSESVTEQRQTAGNYIKVTAGKLVLGVAITATTFGAAVGNLFDRIMPPRPQQTIERVYQPSGPKLSDEIVDMEKDIRAAVKRAVKNKTSPTELTEEIVEILQRKVFLNEERLEGVRELVKEFFTKVSEVALEELLTALKKIVRESVFGESNQGTRSSPSPSPTVSLPIQTATPQR
ncbi:MAG: hypothetical protein JWM21_720 [Acidobacteria bacterium]|nr:hypothetical protein [Acidobacteriota bacterium]